jgi:hypothetical protein
LRFQIWKSGNNNNRKDKKNIVKLNFKLIVRVVRVSTSYAFKREQPQQQSTKVVSKVDLLRLCRLQVENFTLKSVTRTSKVVIKVALLRLCRLSVENFTLKSVTRTSKVAR